MLKVMMIQRFSISALVTARHTIWLLLVCVSVHCYAQETELRRPAAIAVEDVPAVPEELWSELSQYQDTRGASFQGWAPDGRGILISTRFGNASQLHRVYQPEGRR